MRETGIAFINMRWGLHSYDLWLIVIHRCPTCLPACRLPLYHCSTTGIVRLAHRRRCASSPASTKPGGSVPLGTALVMQWMEPLNAIRWSAGTGTTRLYRFPPPSRPLAAAAQAARASAWCLVSCDLGRGRGKGVRRGDC